LNFSFTESYSRQFTNTYNVTKKTSYCTVLYITSKPSKYALIVRFTTHLPVRSDGRLPLKQKSGFKSWVDYKSHHLLIMHVTIDGLLWSSSAPSPQKGWALHAPTLCHDITSHNFYFVAYTGTKSHKVGVAQMPTR